jgi:hypothetical protein
MAWPRNRRAGLDQLHRAFQVRPRGEQHHRQVRMALAYRGEQRPALVTGGGVGAEVHVLDHQVHRLAVQQRQPFLGRGRVQGGEVMQREQHLQRGGHGDVVVDDEDVGHGGSDVVG